MDMANALKAVPAKAGDSNVRFGGILSDRHGPGARGISVLLRLLPKFGTAAKLMRSAITCHCVLLWAAR
jgi:hypothetical protein